MSNSLKQTFKGIGWGGLSTAVNVLFQLVFMAVMARLLDPVHFGLIAMANVMLRFLSYFAQMGVGPALIQKPNLVDGDVRAAISISIGISVLCAVAAIGSAHWIAEYFTMPDLAPVIQVLSLNFVLSGLSAISLSLLRRNMQFKQIAILESTAYVLGYGLFGITMAYFNCGVWALVGAVLSQNAITTALAYWFSKHEFGWRHDKNQRDHFFNFGARYSFIGFIEFLSGSLDALIIGKFFGSAYAGIYGRASLLTNLPVQQPANIITRALFPVISRLGDHRQAASLQISALVLGTYASAVSMGILAAAPDVVRVLLGDKWLDAIPIVQILALAITPQYLSHLVGVTLDAMGALKPKLHIQAVVLASQIAAFSLLMSYGVLGIASAIVIAEWLRFALMAVLVVRLLHPPMREFRIIFVIIGTAGLVAYGLIFLASHALPHEAPRWAYLLLELVTGMLALLSVVWGSRDAMGTLTVVQEMVHHVPLLGRLIPIPNLVKAQQT